MLYAQVKDSIEKEIEERQQEKLDKKEEDEVMEARGFMELISKQQQQLADLVRGARQCKSYSNHAI